MPFKNKIVLITGGSGGLGKAVTRSFLDHGATVVVSYIVDKEIEELKQTIGDAQNLDCMKADLTDENSVKNLFGAIAEKYGKLDILANLIGGFWMGGDISEMPFSEWNHMISLNLTTTFLCTREAFSLMKKNDGGKIITISARAALELPPGMAAYTTGKAAVLALTKTLASEGKDYNVQANAILPSIIDTETNRQAMPNADFDKWVKPQEIAEAILALCSQETAVISGTAVKVYGRV